MMRTLLLAAALWPAAPALAAPDGSPRVVSVPTAPVDPARLAVAERLAVRLMPSGSYRRMMSGILDAVAGSTTTNMMAMPVRDLMQIGGMDPAKVASMGQGSIREIAEIIDPAFERRMKISMDIMMAGMSDIMSAMEPDLRAGVAEVYARRFTLNQLNDIERFFQSPSGSAYAEQSMLMASDPAMIQRAQSMMPKMMEAMPMLARKAEEATANLPKRRKPDDLSSAEKARLGQLLGVDAKEIK